jgi:hypothetical protein
MRHGKGKGTSKDLKQGRVFFTAFFSIFCKYEVYTLHMKSSNYCTYNALLISQTSI